MRRSRNFCQGGGSSPDCQKTALTTFCFFSLQLILQFYSGLSMFYFKEHYNFPRFQRGSNIFAGGPTFSGGGGGGLILFCIETHRNCDYPGGGGPDPLFPL